MIPLLKECGLVSSPEYTLYVRMCFEAYAPLAVSSGHLSDKEMKRVT